MARHLEWTDDGYEQPEVHYADSTDEESYDCAMQRLERIVQEAKISRTSLRLEVRQKTPPPIVAEAACHVVR